MFKIKQKEQIIPTSKECFTTDHAKYAMRVIKTNIMKLESYYVVGYRVDQMYDFKKKLIDYVL